MREHLRIKKERCNLWFLQQKKWYGLWINVSRGFDSRQEARDYVTDLRALARVERILIGNKG